MTTLAEAYCNITTDLLRISDLEAYDRKKKVTNWETHSGNVYRAGSVGYVSMLYRNDEELGAAQANLAAVDAADEWYFDSALDRVYYYDSTTDPNKYNMEAGEDWATLKQRVVDEKAEFIRSYYQRPIYSLKGVNTQSASGRDWDNILIHCNAVLAVADLIRDKNPAKADALELSILSEEPIGGTGHPGLLVMLKRGDIALQHEGGTPVKIEEKSVDAATTGAMLDVIGSPTVNFDAIKVWISTAGTFAAGTTSTVEYSSKVRDSTGLQMSLVKDGEIIHGGYQEIGRGLQTRFAEGVYTADDEWRVTLSGLREENPAVKSISMVRF